MLDLPMWRNALEQGGFAVELAWPEQDHTPMRQHLIVARAVCGGRLDTEAIAHALRTDFGDRLPPVCVRQYERLDGHSEGHGDDHRDGHKDIRPTRAESTAQNPGEHPTDGTGAADRLALERQVAAVWQELLTQPIQRESDFFQCGGDSLIATRMVARLNRMGLRDASLQGLFTHPCLAGFCATLAEPVEANAPSPLIPLARGNAEGSAFMFHASDGELGAYLPLAKHLDMDVFGLQAPAQLEAGSLSELAAYYMTAIRRQQPTGPYTLIGWSYGTFLAAEAARLMSDGATQVVLALIDPVCRADFAFKDQASLLRLLANGRIQVALPDDLECLDPDEQLACFTRQAASAGLLPFAPDPSQARAWLERISHLLDMLARHPAPDRLPIPCLWLSAARRLPHWRPAERDWAAWEAQAEHHTLDSDHWQLLLDDASDTAALLLQWHHRHTTARRRTA
jgi:yersiniabactin nonribosomal peptide/polyketide synthase